MKHFLIYTNSHKDKNLVTTKRIQDYLESRGQRCTVRLKEPDSKCHAETDGKGCAKTVGSTKGEMEAGAELEDSVAVQTESCAIPEDIDCMIALGGDGTMLQAVRDIKKRYIPLVGVNLGTLGYMAEIEPNGLEEALDQLIAGNYESESRMMLNGKVMFQDGHTEEDWALNDIVISRSGSLQIIRFSIYVNGQFLNHYHADGMIVTTPTGSTGYNLSAGGPLVEPKAQLLMLTPICPHTLNKRSIILSPEDVIEIEIPEGKEGQSQLVDASFDGTHVVHMRTGDRIRIVKSEKTTEIIQLNQVSFLEVLHKKFSDS